MKISTALLAAPLLLASALPAVAQDAPSEDIMSPVPEAQEDCEALAERLRAQRDDNALNARDLREMRDKGC